MRFFARHSFAIRSTFVLHSSIAFSNSFVTSRPASCLAKVLVSGLISVVVSIVVIVVVAMGERVEDEKVSLVLRRVYIDVIERRCGCRNPTLRHMIQRERSWALEHNIDHTPIWQDGDEMGSLLTCYACAEFSQGVRFSHSSHSFVVSTRIHRGTGKAIMCASRKAVRWPCVARCVVTCVENQGPELPPQQNPFGTVTTGDDVRFEPFYFDLLGTAFSIRFDLISKQTQKILPDGPSWLCTVVETTKRGHKQGNEKIQGPMLVQRRPPCSTAAEENVRCTGCLQLCTSHWHI